MTQVSNHNRPVAPIPTEVNLLVKNVYGRKLTYPADKFAENLVALTGNTTINEEQIKLLQALGFKINMRVAL